VAEYKTSKFIILIIVVVVVVLVVVAEVEVGRGLAFLAM